MAHEMPFRAATCGGEPKGCGGRESTLEGKQPDISAHRESFAYYYATDRGLCGRPSVGIAAAHPFADAFSTLYKKASRLTLMHNA